MPSQGRTSIPSKGPAPLTSAVDVTLRLAGSMVTIDLPSTRPTIQPADWALVAVKADAPSALASASTFILANMRVAPCTDPHASGGRTVHADAASYEEEQGSDAEGVGPIRRR